MRKLHVWVMGIALTVIGALTNVSAQDTTLTLIAPIGGEIFYTTRDTTVDIRWSGVDDTISVRLDYTLDNGRLWKVIADSAKGGLYVWNIKGIGTSASYRVRVSQLRPPGAQDNIIYSGHSSPVADAWWSPSFDRVVSVAAEAHIWDAQQSSSTPLTTLPVPRATYYSVRWSLDSMKIVTGSDDNRAVVVDVPSNTVAQSIVHPDIVTKVELDSTGQWLFTKADDNRVRVYNLPNAAARATHSAGSTLEDMILNAQGLRVLLCANEARVYGRAVGLPLAFTGHDVGVISGAWSPDGTKVCTVGGDATIRLWSATTGVEAWNVNDQREGVRCAAFSPDGSLVAVGMADSTITVWNVATGQRHTTFGGYTGAVRMVAFTADGTLLAGASDDNFARIHQLSTNTTLRNLQHNDDVNVVRWNESGDRLLTTSRDGTARVWQVREIVLQSDTSGTFTIAPPPPAFARFTSTGDTIQIRENTTITVALEGAQFLDLAQIDSLRLHMVFDPSMLFRIGSSVPLENVYEDVITDSNGIRRSRQYFEVTLPLPTADAPLFTVSFQGTLGQDSVSALSVTRVDQIGTGPGMRVESRAEPILVQGICREGSGPRLFSSVGTALEIQSITAAEGIHIRVLLAESGPTDLALYDLQGGCVWRGTATATEEQARQIDRIIPFDVVSGMAILSVITSTQSASAVVMEAAR